jgi:hypothetical protein
VNSFAASYECQSHLTDLYYCTSSVPASGIEKEKKIEIWMKEFAIDWRKI